MILRIKYQGPRHCVLGDFLICSCITLSKTDEPPNEAPFDHRGILLTIFVEDH